MLRALELARALFALAVSANTRTDMPLLGFEPQQLSAKKLLAIVSLLATLYSVARVGVLFFESLAIVREERGQDAELLELCHRGDARASPKMRDACLKARADRASPLVAKAIVYAVSTAFKDFSDTIGSPVKFSIVLLFLLSSIILPISSWSRAILGCYTPPTPSDYNGTPQNHFIVMAPPNGNGKRHSAWRKRIGKHVPLLRQRPTIEEVEEEYFHGMEPGAGGSCNGFYNVPFCGGSEPLHPHAD